MELKTHSPEWEKLFGQEKKLLTKILGEELVDVQHVGSTAIPNIKSKPIIDIAIFVKNFEDKNFFTKKLEELGYKYSKEKSSTERHFFTKENSIKYYLSIANPKTSFFQRQTAFRDYLINHPEKAKEYEKIKEKLIKKFPSGKDKYSHGKSEFVKQVLRDLNF